MSEQTYQITDVRFKQIVQMRINGALRRQLQKELVTLLQQACDKAEINNQKPFEYSYSDNRIEGCAASFEKSGFCRLATIEIETFYDENYILQWDITKVVIKLDNE